MLNTGNNAVAIGAYMIINVPPGIDNISNAQADTGFVADPIIEFDDGSSQIPVQLTTTLAANGGVRTYSFLAEVPSISVPAHYSFLITANGTSAGSGALVGPQSTVVIQICPTGGC